MTTTHTFDPLGRLTGVSSTCVPGAGCPSATIYQYSIQPHGAQVQSFTDSVVGGSTGVSPQYDGFNRLQSIAYPSDAASVSLRGQQASWRYDRYGNRLSQATTALGSNAAPSIDPTTNRASLYGFDVAGNMTADGTYSYAFDDEGRQARNSLGSTYSYDASGRIASATNNGKVQVFVYGLQDRRIAVLDASSGVTTSYQVYAGGQEMAFETGGQITYQYQNQVSSEGARLKNGVLTTFSSLPYGDGQTSTGGADEDTAHFAGLDTLAQSPNTLHAGYRDYHFNSGRWMSPDPYDGSYDGTDPQSLNRYTYGLNNPLAISDPLGLDGYVRSGNCIYYMQTAYVDGEYDSTDYYLVSCNNGPIGGTGQTVGGLGDGTTASSKPAYCSKGAGGNKVIYSASYAYGLGNAGAAIGAIFGPAGAVAGFAIGNSIGVGVQGSYVPSTHSIYFGPTLSASPFGGGGFSFGAAQTSAGQNPNSVASGQSYSLQSQPMPFAGGSLTYSPGSGPPVPGFNVGTKSPVSGNASYSFCLHNCGC